MRTPNLPTHAEFEAGRHDGYTGRYLITFKPGAVEQGMSVLRNAGFSVISVPDSEAASQRPPEQDVEVLGETGIALLSGEGDHLSRIAALASRADSPVKAVTREKVIRRAGFSAQTALATPAGFASVLPPENWGLVVTRAYTSGFTGKGVKIAFADTGLDHNHPDFTGRVTEGASFVPNTPPQDHVGHGTHCAGIAAGPSSPSGAPRYGVAGGAAIVIAKVTTDAGFGAQQWLINGCRWAVNVGCRIICVAIEDAVSPGQSFDPAYEALARDCASHGTLIIAAAGNNSDRETGRLRPVSSPADCPSIMGVGAMAATASGLVIANFSNVGGLNAGGSNVDLCGPGVSILSAFPMPVEYKYWNGTSQAAAYVAGIAALLLEAQPSMGPANLWTALVQSSKPSPFPPTEAGAGLVQAPQ